MHSSRAQVTAWLAGALLCGTVSAQVTRRVSVDSSEVQGNTGSGFHAISADGRFVAFVSTATNLVPGDTNVSDDVFLRDLQSGTTERVSVSSSSVQGNGPSGIFTADTVSISADGRYVAFESLATNLVAGDTNATYDVFVRDRQTGTTQRVSVDSSGGQANGNSTDTAISADGRFVAFMSDATNLVPGDTNGWPDIFVRDRQTGTTERVSIDSSGTQGNFTSLGPALSADGRFVAFESLASNLVPGDTNGTYDVIVRDRQSSTTELASVDSGGAHGNGANLAVAISADGRFVAFHSDSTNLVLGDTNGFVDVFVRDRQGGTTERVSIDSGGAQGNGDSTIPAISADGRYVTFDGTASNLVPGDTNGTFDVFRRDRLSGTTERVSVDTAGAEADSASSTSSNSISADGNVVAFWSWATNLVAGDTNSDRDVFIHDSGAGRTEHESDGIGGSPSNGPSSSPAVSPDGRYVAFESDASNLGLVGTNGFKDIFLRDRQTGAITRVSVDTGGTQSDGNSFHPAVSDDGRYVAFDSVATDLVPGDTNAVSDVFMRDLVTGTTTRVSVDTAGAQSNGASSNPAMSADGRFVAFDSAATNLVAGDTNIRVDVFVRDRQVGTITRVSVDSGGTQGLGGDSSDPSISASGSSVAFESTAPNLVSGDTNGAMDVFVRNVIAGTTTRWSVDSTGVQGNGDSSNAAMSGDGLHLAFQSDATNLVVGDSNLAVDVFVRDQSGTTNRVNVDSGGTQGLGGDSTDPSISVDGRSVAFASGATNLVGGDTNGAPDIFVNDRLTGETRRVSIDSDGAQGGGASGGSAISADGRFIAFDSFASNLVLGDTNGFQDVFVRDEGTASAFESFCFGDGSGSPCPCNNSGAAGHGCENSGSTGGALLTVTGSASLSADGVQFTSSFEKPTALSIFLQGTTATSPVTYGDGLRCTSGTLKRIFVKSAVGGVAVAPQAGDLSISARSAFLNAPISLGATREYQVYYRDSTAGFCPSPPGSTFNVSNGMIVAWGG